MVVCELHLRKAVANTHTQAKNRKEENTLDSTPQNEPPLTPQGQEVLLASFYSHVYLTNIASQANLLKISSKENFQQKL